MFTRKMINHQTMAITCICLALNFIAASPTYTMEQSLKVLKESDKCHERGLHFCIHANGMCYRQDQYCEKGSTGQVHDCLPKETEKARSLCEKVLRKEDSLPHFQCEWACEHRFRETLQTLKKNCSSPWLHICPHADDKCYGPEQFCGQGTIGECLPANEGEAQLMCETIRKGGDSRHPQCEWACESRFPDGSSGTSDGNELLVIIICAGGAILGLFLLLYCIGFVIVIIQCRKDKRTENKSTCMEILHLLVYPCAIPMRKKSRYSVHFKDDKEKEDLLTDPSGNGAAPHATFSTSNSPPGSSQGNRTSGQSLQHDGGSRGIHDRESVEKKNGPLDDEAEDIGGENAPARKQQRSSVAEPENLETSSQNTANPVHPGTSSQNTANPERPGTSSQNIANPERPGSSSQNTANPEHPGTSSQNMLRMQKVFSNFTQDNNGGKDVPELNKALQYTKTPSPTINPGSYFGSENADTKDTDKSGPL